MNRDGLVTSVSPSPLPETSTTARDRNTYDYRLAVSRKLYDSAGRTERSHSLAALAPGAAVDVHPLDFDQTGVAAGTDVRVISARGAVVLPLVANPAVPRGTVWAPFNQRGVDIRDLDGLHRARHRRTDRATVSRGVLLAVDPLLDGGLLWTPLMIVLVKVVVVFVLALVSTMLMVWFERKVIAGMQNRVGPNKAGPFGILQTLADGIKLFFKEDLLPDRARQVGVPAGAAEVHRRPRRLPVPTTTTTSPGERFGYVYEIRPASHPLRPVRRGAPRRSPSRSCSSSRSATGAATRFYTKDELLVGDDGKPKILEDWP